MARNTNQFQQYKNRVQGAVQRDLLQDVNFQNAELFKRNIYNQQVNQGLSYNQYQNNIRRKLNDAANGIFFESQNGLVGSSALRQQIQTQQNADTAVSGTANSYTQSQLEASKQLNQANLSQKQLEEEYTRQEAEKMYQQDLSDVSSNERSRRKKTSALFGAFSALGAILSFIPPFAPLGFALDAIGAAGMVGTSAYELSQNPSGGNIAQFGIDTLFAGLTLIPGISALKGVRGKGGISAARGINAATKGLEVSTASSLVNTIQDTANIAGNATRALPGTTDFIAGRAGTVAQESISNMRAGIKAGFPTANASELYGAAAKELNNATSLESAISAAQKAGLSSKETTQILKEVAKDDLSFGKNIPTIFKDPNNITIESLMKSKEANNPGFWTKFKNKAHDSLKFKSTYDRMGAAEIRREARVGDLIGSRRILANARSIAGTVTRGAVRGVAIGGTRYISSTILNNYLGESKELSTTQITWRKVFDELGIPKNLRPKGL